MKKIIFLIVLILSISCTTTTDSTPKVQEGGIVQGGTIEFPGAGTVVYQIVEIEGCEYILGHDNGFYNGGFFMTHKGNCKNPIHQHNE